VHKPTLIWLEQLNVPQDTEIPERLLAQLEVRTCTSTEELNGLVNSLLPAAIFFNFDYPDRGQLASFARAKKRFTSVPMVMVTLQHSETLAVWAFREGALDYLIKPLDPAELASCIERIVGISTLQGSQDKRIINTTNASIPSEVPRAVHGKKQKLSPAICFVQQHYSERIYSDAMARLCGMSPTHFSHAFKQTFDVTFQQFILRYRVREACKLLQSPSANISDVAYNVGFSDPSYFTRVFKRYVGTSPSSFVSGVVDLPKSQSESEAEAGTLTSSSQVVRQLSGNFSR
jgi:AraC-like DNA-binding protein